MSLYSRAAGYVLGVILLFVAINVAAWLALGARDWIKASGGGSLPGNPWADRARLYPGWTSADIYDLYMETWERRGYEYVPVSEFREAPFQGRFVNVTENGYRKGRRDDSWPPDSRRFNIFVFGGSTIFGYGLPDGETTPAILETALERAHGAPVSVYNFGRAFFFSTHELLEFERLLMSGVKPDAAVFIDGLNELYYLGADLLWTERLRRAVKAQAPSVANTLVSLAMALPAYELTTFVLRYVGAGTVERERQAEANVTRILGEGDPEKIETALDRYLRNKALIETLGRHYGVPVAFVWQPVPTYKYDLNHHLFAYRDMRDHLSSGAGYRRAAERFARGDFGANFAWCADIQEGVAKPLYVDAVHYSAELAAMLADCIVAKTPLKDLATHRSPKG